MLDSCVCLCGVAAVSLVVVADGGGVGFCSRVCARAGVRARRGGGWCCCYRCCSCSCCWRC